MNLTKKRKKKGFTLIELMAVVAIIAILAAVLVPTVNGYIMRAKKTAIITQIRTVVNAVESYDATANTKVSTVSGLNLKDIIGDTTAPNKENTTVINFVAQGLIDSNDVSKLNLALTYEMIKDMNEEVDLTNALTVDNGAIKYNSTVVSN